MGGLPPPAFVIALYAAEYLPQFTLSSDSKISTLVTLVLLNSAVLGLLCKVEMVVLLARGPCGKPLHRGGRGCTLKTPIVLLGP